MADMDLQKALRRVLEEQPSFVGELAYAADEELSRTFGKLMCMMHADQASTEELLCKLEAFGEAVHRVGDRYSRVTHYYDRLVDEAKSHLAAEVRPSA